MQELLLFIKRKDSVNIQNNSIKYYIGSILWGSFIGGSIFIFKFIEPSILFTSTIHFFVSALFTILLILFLAFYKNRLFCRCICPVGVFFGFLSKFSLFKIYIDLQKCENCKKCEKSCPVSCINVDKKYIDNENCLKCFKCIEICPSNAVKYRVKQKEKKQKFNINRRKFIVSFSALALFAVVVKSTEGFIQVINSKLKKVILPPGAVDCNQFVHSCYNCNLCVTNCPSNIIERSNSDYPVVHINYKNGYCRENCIKCSEVCPSDAIKKITLEQKNKIKIANAMIVSDKCTHCDLCVKACQFGAITKEDYKLPVIDNSKCIGCGACKFVCDSSTIDLFALDS